MRKPVVSHTFNGLEITALILNVTTREQDERVFYVARTPPGNEKKTADRIRSVIESQLGPDEKFVVALKSRQAPRRYYMSEDEFVRLGHEAPLLKTSKYNTERKES